MGNALRNYSASESRLRNRGSSSNPESPDQIFKNEKDGKNVLLAITRFALDVYKEQGKRSKGNLFMSPLSISAVLSMAYLGARGKTLEEMKKTLCFDALEDSGLHQAFRDLISHLAECSKGSEFQLHMANGLYRDQSFKILDEFQNSCQNHYDAELIPGSFRNKPNHAIAEINNWVEEITKNKIKNILSTSDVDSPTVLILVNAIYFKSDWQYQFQPSDTEKANFFVSKDQTIEVQMMSQMVKKADYYYSKQLSCQVLKLPYKSGALCMFILLPDKSSSLLDLDRKMTAQRLVNIDSGFQKRPDMNLWLPKFKMEESLQLTEILGDMGMKSIFEAGSADLSGIDGGKHELYVSKVVHKAFLDVNEEGVEAGAATAAIVRYRSKGAKPESPVDFRADHPFLFFIREEKAKAILFMGRAITPIHSVSEVVRAMKRSASSMVSHDQVFKNDTDGKNLISAITRFALDLYKEQGKRSKGNLFMSPLSISAALSMTCLGARGQTLEEMKKILCFDALEDAGLHQTFGEFISHLAECSKGTKFQLHMANRLYGEESFKILEEFQNSCRNHYGAELIPVSFSTQAGRAVTEINNWVEEITKNKIKDILSTRDVDPLTVLVLVNAIYFKGNWQYQFKTSDTKQANFFASTNQTIKVRMMFLKVKRADYYHSNDLSCQVLKLPYKSGAVSMFILLPDKSSSLMDLEGKLTAQHLVNIDSGFQESPDVNLWLPKFKMEETLQLKEVLRDMGMKSVFGGSANLSGIDGTKNLYVTKVVHKAFVDVNEEGTEAAAATAVVVGLRSVSRNPVIPVNFRADHPFLFFIREEKTKAILFMGRAVAPIHS